MNSEENLKWTVSNQIAKSNDKTHQTKGQQGTGIFKCRKWEIKPCFTAPNLILVLESYKIPLYLQRCVNKTDIYLSKYGSRCNHRVTISIRTKTNKYLTKKHKKNISNLTSTFTAYLFLHYKLTHKGLKYLKSCTTIYLNSL